MARPLSLAFPLSLARPPLPQLDDRELACIFLSLQGIDSAHMCVMVCMCDLALMCVSAHLCDLACMCVLPWSLQGMGRTLARCWPGIIWPAILAGAAKFHLLFYHQEHPHWPDVRLVLS